MSWISQNWIWVALAVAILWWIFRGRLVRHGEAGGHGGEMGGLLGGVSGCSGHGRARDDRDSSQPAPSAADAPEAAVDPVSGESVRTAQALTSVYKEKIYYFSSTENRDRFEATPEEFARKVTGHPLSSAEARIHRRRRHGC